MNIALKIAASLNVTRDVTKPIIIEQYFDKSALSATVNHFRCLVFSSLSLHSLPTVQKLVDIESESEVRCGNVIVLAALS